MHDRAGTRLALERRRRVALDLCHEAHDTLGARAVAARLGRVVGTYLHGPVLARNPALADHLLTEALRVDALPPLESYVEDQLRIHRLYAGTARGVRRWWQDRLLARG